MLASWKPLKLSWGAVGGPPLPLPLPRVPRIFARLSDTWQFDEELLTKSDKQLCCLQRRSFSRTCCNHREILVVGWTAVSASSPERQSVRGGCNGTADSHHLLRRRRLPSSSVTLRTTDTCKSETNRQQMTQTTQTPLTLHQKTSNHLNSIVSSPKQ